MQYNGSKNSSTINEDKIIDRIIYFEIYLLIILIVSVLNSFIEINNLLIKTFILDIIATIIIYIFSIIIKNASLYDPYWSVQPIIIGFYWFFFSENNQSLTIRQILALICIIIWGFRLTLNWIRGWKGIKHEDWRYANYRKNFPKYFWVINLTGIQLMPTILVYFGCLSLLPIRNEINANLGFIDILGFLIIIFAIILETLADEQLKNFLKYKKNLQIMDEKLWKYSRHPNYLGEILYWWGIFLVGLGSNPKYFWVIIGPISITLLFLLISIPLMEKRQLQNKPNYKEYQRSTSKLILWFPKKNETY